MTASEAVLIALTAVTLAFCLAGIQSFIGAKVGTDHPVHAFLIRGIRENRHRLFIRIPNLLNTAHCAALPLYVHWLLAFFRPAATFWAERLLNPAINAVHTVIFASLAFATATAQGETPGYVATTTLLFALTPQFYHALSARNFGLSARGTGLMLLTLFLLACHGVDAMRNPAPFWLLLVASSWLIWSFSTFTQQALCIFSLLLLLITGRATALSGLALGLIVFVAVHPRYSLSYLRHTLRFIRAYATELAPIYILKRHHSLWRDLVWDIWLRFRQGPRSAVLYAYENTFVIIVLLNPLLVVALWAKLSQSLPASGLVSFAGTVSLVGAVAVLLTSFRFSRFLGEPERYAEAVTPWAVLAGGHAIAAAWGTTALAALALAFALLDALQLLASKMLQRHINAKGLKIGEIAACVNATAAGEEVRFCSNNEQITKLAMQNPWQFSYFIAVGQDYCGMRATEAFTTFPHLRRDACERVVAAYRITACVLDRSLYEDIFADGLPAGLTSIEQIHQTDVIRVLRLHWDRASVAGQGHSH